MKIILPSLTWLWFLNCAFSLLYIWASQLLQLHPTYFQFCKEDTLPFNWAVLSCRPNVLQWGLALNQKYRNQEWEQKRGALFLLSCGLHALLILQMPWPAIWSGKDWLGGGAPLAYWVSSPKTRRIFYWLPPHSLGPLVSMNGWYLLDVTFLTTKSPGGKLTETRQQGRKPQGCLLCTFFNLMGNCTLEVGTQKYKKF